MLRQSEQQWWIHAWWALKHSKFQHCQSLHILRNNDHQEINSCWQTIPLLFITLRTSIRPYMHHSSSPLPTKYHTSLELCWCWCWLCDWFTRFKRSKHTEVRSASASSGSIMLQHPIILMLFFLTWLKLTDISKEHLSRNREQQTCVAAFFYSL